MSEINKERMSAEQKDRIVARARRLNQKRRAKLEQVVSVQQTYLANDPNVIEIGAGTCDIYGLLCYQWVDATLVFPDGTISFSGNGWAASLIAADGGGVATLFVPLDQIPANGQVSVVADAEEAGAASLTFQDSYGNVLAELVAVLEGAGVDTPIGCSGTYTVTTS